MSLHFDFVKTPNMIYVISVFKGLGIETEEDVHKLIPFFICKAEEKRPDTESSEDGKTDLRLRL